MATLQSQGSRKRKSDALGRIHATNTETSSNQTTGRGVRAGWTTCPLCGRHSQKRYALGRGIATHLHAVHTPWKPGMIERRKRRRLAERKAHEQRRHRSTCTTEDETASKTIEENLVETWEPSSQEINAWEKTVLQIVGELDAQSQDYRDEATTSTQFVRPGLDRRGIQGQEYRESLPPFLQAAANGNLEKLNSMVAAMNGNPEKPNEAVITLLDTRDRNLSLAEHWAAGSGHLHCLQYLFRLRQECEESPTNHEKSVLLITSKVRRRDGKTCLHYAARNGHMDCVRYLVEDCKYAVDEASGDSTTPFHMACFGGHKVVAEYLLQQGANLCATNDWGCTAAHWVALTSNTEKQQVREFCGMLQRYGVSFVKRQKQGHSALHKAAQKRNCTVIEWMGQTKEEGGAGLTADERLQAGQPDDGGHTAHEIWISFGGCEEFAKRMKEEWEW